ncbi:apolipoprotein D-like isoform X1 [Daphnia pulex]|uniref:apolipoprotein D-like isoform X1 n=1 Tax=Daphnia pulex TaxID=6669 RepID=UPI001EDD8F4B|nr:apolipoprotein D-like isoform X1 [Daphnia pulex]
MHSSIILTVLLMLIGVINCQTLNFGRCPALDVKQDFDLAKYAGKWYEYSKNRRYWIIMDSGLKCASETYTLEGDDTLLMHNEGQRIINNRPVSVKAVGKHVAPGKLLFSFNSVTLHGTAAEDVPYWILDTDYTNYSVVWSCSENAGVNAQVTWILTREIKPDPSVVRTAMEVLSRNGLGRTSMVTTNHRSNCRPNYRYFGYPSGFPISPF